MSKVAYPQELHSYPPSDLPILGHGYSRELLLASLRFLYRARRSPRVLMVVRSLAGIAAILLLTFFYRYIPRANETTVGFSYLLIFLVASSFLEFKVLLVMSVLATGLYDFFFLPPVGTLNINDPRDWLALFAFLTTAIVGTRLSTQARLRAEEAQRKRKELKRLYDLSQKLLGIGDPAELLGAIPGCIVESFETGPASLYVSDQHDAFHSGEEISPLDIRHLMAVNNGELRPEELPGARFTRLQLGSRNIGCIGILAPFPSNETLEAMATLVGIAIDRSRAIQNVASLEASRERERFKSILLDAIAHDFRTPLTSIKVSATGLLNDLEFGREQRQELLTIIDEECDRISELVGEACELARLESGEVHLNLGSHQLGTLISVALADCGEIAKSRAICLNVKHDELPLLIDLSLAKKVLVHLIVNAHLYSSQGQPITISTERGDGFHLISVADHGPGIQQKELSRIFEKFYRGSDHRLRVHGTGMGLAISKAIVEAHGGIIKATSRVGYGSTFTFGLPIDRTATKS